MSKNTVPPWSRMIDAALSAAYWGIVFAISAFVLTLRVPALTLRVPARTPATPQAGLPLGTGVCLSNSADFLAFGTGVAGDTLSLTAIGLPPYQLARLIISDVPGIYHVPFTVGWVCMDTNYMWGWDVRPVWGSGWVGWAVFDTLPYAGRTLYFQGWCRLPYGGSEFTDAVEITFS